MDFRVTLLVLAGLAVLLVTAASTIGFRLSRRASRADAGERPAVWFLHVRVSGFMLVACLLLWVPAAVSAALRTRLPAWNPAVILGFAGALLLIPPLLASLGYALTSRALVKTLRGADWTARKIAAQWFWNLCGLFVPLVLATLGVLFATDGMIRVAVVFGAAALVLFVAASDRKWSSQGIEPHVLNAGELHDKAIALSARAGVRIRRFVILHSLRGPLANAFAASGRAILLSADLVRALPPEEVDAILAHEIAHLKKHHVPQILVAAIAPIFLLGWLFGKVPIAFVAGNHVLLALPFALLISGALVRSMERSADRGGSELVEDPRAAIRALARITRMNLLPSRWSGWDTKAFCHPSLEKRAEALAKRFQIPLAEVADLLEPRPPGPERYPLPELAERTLLARHQQRGAKGRFFTQIACLIAPVVGATWALPFFPAPAVWPAAAFASAAAAVCIPHWRSLWGFRRLEIEFRKKTGISSGIFAGFSPDRAVRFYDGLPFWGIGLIWIESDCLTYRGERTQFSLKNTHITDVQMKRDAPGWIRWNSILFEGVVSTFRIFAFGKESELMREIDQWRKAPAVQSECEFAAPGLPRTGGLAAREVVGGSAMIVSAVIVMLLAAGATTVFAREWTLYPAFICPLAMLIGDAPYYISRRARR